MKKTLILLFSLIGLSIIAQQEAPPKGINYQAIVYANNNNTSQPGLDAPGQVLWNEDIGVQFSILSGSETGTIIYKETHATITDEYGMFNLVIGQGLVQGTQSFNMIDWGSGYHFLKVEVDKTGGTDYVEMSNQQLWSVPYALYSGYSSSSGYADSSAYTDIAGNGLTGVVDNGDGTLTFTYYDGSTYTTSVLSGLGSVGPQGPAGADGQDGQDGLSAYEIWLAQGNTGTGSDYINSITGPTGANGIDGVDGTDGQSAYEIWLSLGNTGTEQDFLNSLEGPQGATGQSFGKTYLYLDGDISDAEAVQRIQNDVGPNTQFINISNTTNLTNVDLSGYGITDLIELIIFDNQSLNSIVLPDLKTVYTDIQCESNPALSAFELDSLLFIGRDMWIENTNLSLIEFPQLTTSRGNIWISANSVLTGVIMNNLSEVKEDLYVDGNALNINQIQYDNIIQVGTLGITSCPLINSLNFPTLVTITDNFNLQNNDGLTSIDLTNLSSVNTFGITSCPLFTNFNLPNISEITTSFQVGSNALTVSTVNNLLNTLVSINPPLSGINISMWYQNPAAPPSGQGITDKATLIANGNTVNTD